MILKRLKTDFPTKVIFSTIRIKCKKNAIRYMTIVDAFS